MMECVALVCIPQRSIFFGTDSISIMSNLPYLYVREMCSNLLFLVADWQCVSTGGGGAIPCYSMFHIVSKTSFLSLASH